MFRVILMTVLLAKRDLAQDAALVLEVDVDIAGIPAAGSRSPPGVAR